jgi:hypothetical protein
MSAAWLCGRPECRQGQEVTDNYRPEQGIWRFHDNYFGEPWRKGGVFLEGRPVWMAADGSKARTPTPSGYAFCRGLREAQAFPVRGPDELSEGPSAYRNAHEGGVANFGRDHSRGRPVVYTARYLS